MGKVWLKKDRSLNYSCSNGRGVRCHFTKQGDCKKPRVNGNMPCFDSSYTEITEQQFNDTPGIKYSIKNGVRTEILEEVLYLHINGEKFPVFIEDTAKEIEKRINTDQEYADAIIIMEDKK